MSNDSTQSYKGMDNDAEMGSALDDIFGGADDADGNQEQPEEEQMELENLDQDGELEEEELEEEEEDTHGHVGYEEYIKKGGKPDDYVGINAFNKRYALQQNEKEHRKTMRDMKSLVQASVDASKQMQADAYERGKAELQSQLDEAYAEGDVRAIKDAQGKIDDMVAPPPEARQSSNPLHDEYFENNPILDKGSAQFDPEFMADFQDAYNARLDALGSQKRLSDRAMKYHMKAAMDATKPMYPEKFTSIRNKRTGSKTTARRATTARGNKPSKTARVEGANPHNQDDQNAGNDMYEYLKGLDPDVAATFKKNMQGNR